MFDGNKKIEINNSLSAILAILLMAIYFITDFLTDKNLFVGAIYALILGLTIGLSAKKTSFHEVIYNLTQLLILGEILKNSVPYFKNLEWIFNTLMRQFKFSTETYIKSLFSTPYIYFYLIGVLLLLICKFAPNLCQSSALKNVFNTLGNYSLWAIVTYMCALCFSKYELIENVIFFVFMIGAFWTAYTKEQFKRSDIIKAIMLVIEIAIFILLYLNQYTAFVENLQSAEGITWIYSIGLFVICVLCILSEQISQDVIIGFAILGTNLMFFYGKLNQVMIPVWIMVLFHIGALSFYYIVKNMFALDFEYQKKQYLKILLGSGYIMALLLTLFIANQFIKSTTMLCIGLVFALIYFGNLVRVKGTVYGTLIYGAIPWILLETTMTSLGKMDTPLFSVILFTILFWCVCSVALSWKDTAHIKAIAFEKANSEMIINGLSGIAYLLTALVLFV